MNKQHVHSSPTNREYLEALIIKGELKAKTYRRALSLLELDRGQTYTAVSKHLFIFSLLRSTEHEKYVRLCVSLPVRLLRRFAQAMYLCRTSGDEISKAHLWSHAGSY